MAKWQRTLNLLPEWRQAQDGEIAPQVLAGVIGKRLRTLRPFGDPTGLDYEREEIAERFEDFATEDDAEIDDFDDIMRDLYDWADTQISGSVFDAKKVCWVRTF